MLKKYFIKGGGVNLLFKLLYNKIFFSTCFIFFFLPKNKVAFELLRECISCKIYKKLEKKYSYIIREKNIKQNDFMYKESKKIWICWFQGIENAPQIVKKCYSSVQKYSNGYEIIVITEENYKEYANIPDFIEVKRKNGYITNTHFSDILRTELLLKHGGIWIDATVYMVDYIPNDIIKSKFFLFQTLKPGVDGKSISISSWFIKTIPNNPVLELTQELLYEYWKKHNYLCDYFLFHYFMQISMNYYSHFTDEMVKYTNELPHVLLLQLHKSYNESVYKSITTKSFVHKLTYKVSDDIVNDKSNYYNFLLNSND